MPTYIKTNTTKYRKAVLATVGGSVGTQPCKRCRNNLRQQDRSQAAHAESNIPYQKYIKNIPTINQKYTQTVPNIE